MKDEPLCNKVPPFVKESLRSWAVWFVLSIYLSVIDAWCSFSLYLTVDSTPPECVNLPADITQTVELGTPNTEVFYIEPTCSDISGTASVIASTHTPPASFNVGVTTVSYTCGDASGNRETCSFTVTVTPGKLPSPIPWHEKNCI